MAVEESAEEQAGEQPQRRATPRLSVDGPASLLVVKHELRVACRVVDLSRGGCRIRTEEKFLAGPQSRVEVSFTVNGLIFRLNGLTQWADGAHELGIRFVDVTSRRMDELVELLTEVEEENAAKAAKLAAEAQALAALAEAPPEAEPEPVLEDLPAPRVESEPETEAVVGAAAGAAAEVSNEAVAARDSEPEPAAAEPAYLRTDPGAGKLPKRERRAQSRYEVDTSAAIYLINVGSRLNGRIVDLSVGGCRIRTMEHFPVGIYTRVETEFRLEGLPFRLGGVIQAVHDRGRFNIGIRFLDMSERKREQLEQLIREIEEMHEAREYAAEAREAGETGTA